VGNVREVLELIPITKLPKTPDYMSGVVNVRGSVVPVIDLRQKLGMSKGEKTVDTCIIVIEIPLDNAMTILGVMVDSVQEVMEFDPSQIDPPPRIGERIRSDFLIGIGKKDDRFVMIMKITEVISSEDAELIRGAGA
jgi:purine-binding chemotaxis protein CheW